MLLLLSADFFQNKLFFQKLFNEHYQSVKRLGSSPGHDLSKLLATSNDAAT